MNYYAHPFCSNSDLTKLKQELMAPDEVKEYANALRFGTLVHAVILEPDTVDYIIGTVVGTDYRYTKEEIDTARKMKVSFMNDSFCRMLLKQCATEVEMYQEDTPFSYNGIDFAISTRRKYDLWSPQLNWGGDIKSTTAKSETQFLSAVRQFDYERARVFYSKGPGALQDVIIGISKYPPYKVFKVLMKAGDALWQAGERKMNEIAYKYWALKSPQTVQS